MTGAMMFKIGIELALGLSMKMFCDNGRIHPSDFVNDFFGWTPWVEPREHDGLTRQILAQCPAVETVETVEPARELLAAK